MSTHPELGFVYPGHSWRGRDTDWVKSLLLYFDGIAIFLPQETLLQNLSDSPLREDAALFSALLERELVHQVDPARVIDEGSAVLFQDALLKMMDSPVFLHKIQRSKSFYGQYIFPIRAGHGWTFHETVRETADLIVGELESRGLAVRFVPTEDDVINGTAPHRARHIIDGDAGRIWIDRRVWVAMMTLWAHIIAPNGDRWGMRLDPVSNDKEALADFETLTSARLVTSKVLTLDAVSVELDVDLSSIDDLLDFKGQYQSELYAYRRNVREFLRSLQGLDADQQADALRDRANDLRDQASKLARLTKKAWRRPTARVTLGAAGAGWTLFGGNPIGAILGIGSLLAGFQRQRGPEGPYAYIMLASRL
jgi:hypothetical protein